MLPDDRTIRAAEKYAADFMKELQLDADVEPKCEWTCILWSKDHWAAHAQKTKINLEQTREHLTDSLENAKTLMALFLDSQFLNTVAQVYAKLIDGVEQTCTVKNFANCPFLDRRQNLLKKGSLASVFVTLLQKATFYAMLDRHPLDSGLLHEEYTDVYGIDLTNFNDLENSLKDGRFEKLYQAVTKRASQLAGLRSEQSL